MPFFRFAEEVRPSTATTTQVAASTTVVTLAAADPERRGLTLQNTSKNTLFFKLGASATLTDFTGSLSQNEAYEVPYPVYTGIITGIWTGTNGDVKVTELS